MKEGQSFAEYVGVVEATLGAKADPDRAYEAFTAGVSPEVFVKSVVRNSVKEVPSNLPPESISRSFKIGPSGESFRAADQNITPRQGLIAVFVVALSIIVLSSIWIPIETAKIKKRNEPLPSVPLGPSPRLVTAKVLIRGALNSKDAQRLQAALANAKAVDSSMGDDELKALIVEAQKAFAPLEASWKKSKRDAVQREEAELISALTRATKEKNEAAILAALLKSQGFRVRTGTLSSEHLKAQATAKETIQRIEIASRRKAMRRYEGSPVGIAVGNLEIRRSFDGYTFDGSGRFVSVFVSAMNSGADSEHINPTNFTLETDEGETVPYSSHTFSSRRPLEAVNIGPGATTSGWIVFESVLSRRYRLIHQPMGGERVVKVLVP